MHAVAINFRVFCVSERKEQQMKLDAAREQMVGAIELTDEELASVVGGDGCGGCGRRRRPQRRCLHFGRRYDHQGRRFFMECDRWGWW
jgi:bacteriocin-like protein